MTMIAGTFSCGTQKDFIRELEGRFTLDDITVCLPYLLTFLGVNFGCVKRRKERMCVCQRLEASRFLEAYIS
jgi:hypothetical protein